jgi:hypothetical protein
LNFSSGIADEGGLGVGLSVTRWRVHW